MTSLNKKGFSGLEFIVVITLIVSLIVGSIPLFFYLQKKSRHRHFKNYISFLETEIKAWKAARLLANEDTSPEKLDSQTFPAPCQTCFSEITKPLSSHLWYKTSSNTYLFLIKKNDKERFDSPENDVLKMTYDSVSGKILR